MSEPEERGASSVFDPRVIRRIASTVSLDSLVCTDAGLAFDALPLFPEVHLLDAAAELGGRGGEAERPELHSEPVGAALAKLAAELADARVLFVLGAGDDPAPLGRLQAGWVLLGEGLPLARGRSLLGPELGGEAIDLGAGTLVGPAVLERVLAPLFAEERARAGAAADANGGSGGGSGGSAPGAELEHAEAVIAGLRERNERLEQRVVELRARLEGGWGGGSIRAWRHRLRRLRARLRPIVGIRLGLLWHHRPRELRVPRSYRNERPPDPAPSISIVVPSFNQGEFIARTLDSALDQDYPELELIVQDGGSTDRTPAVLDRYRERIDHLSAGPDGGQADAVNVGLGRSSGEIMAWLNSDDVLLPGTLAYVGRYFAEHPEVDVIYGHRVLVDPDDREIGRWVMPAHDDEVLSWADYVPQETLFWRREIWERSGAVVGEQFRFALDWDLLLRMRDAGAQIVRVPRFLGAFRVHEEQKSSAQVGTIGRGEMDRLRRRTHGRAVSTRETRAAIRPYLRRHALLDKAYRLRLVRY